MRIGLIALAGVKLQTRKFIELGITLPQFVNRGRVIAQLPSLALLTLAGATPDGVELEYVEVDDVASFAVRPRLDFDLVALSTYTARAFDAYLVADVYRAHGVPVVFGGLHATVLPWDRCTLFDVNFRPRGMSVGQLEVEHLGVFSVNRGASTEARKFAQSSMEPTTF